MRPTYLDLIGTDPFPILGSLVDKIIHVISKAMSNRTYRYQPQVDKNCYVEDDPKGSSFDDPYITESFQNSGWLSIMTAFLVNFVVRIWYHVYLGQLSKLKSFLVSWLCVAR